MLNIFAYVLIQVYSYINIYCTDKNTYTQSNNFLENFCSKHTRKLINDFLLFHIFPLLSSPSQLYCVCDHNCLLTFQKEVKQVKSRIKYKNFS